MPLTRGRIVGYDDERLAFGFTMLNDGETVDCQISDAAMDELGGVKGTEGSYIALMDYLVNSLAKALEAPASGPAR